MRFASLGSGSGGNALLVEADGTRILLDCGFALSDLTARMARLGIEPSDLDAIVVTHEHEDHGGGVARLALRHDLPVYLTHGTLAALGNERRTIRNTIPIDTCAPVAIRAIEVRPYPVPHDAREPVQFVFTDGTAMLGVLTDAGRPTPHIVRALSGVNALVLECNYDIDMLLDGPYPPSLKSRVAGPMGHLANAAAAEIVQAMDCSRLQHVIAAHLSEKNNTPALARSALAGALNCEEEWICVATQQEGFGWRQILP